MDIFSNVTYGYKTTKGEVPLDLSLMKPNWLLIFLILILFTGLMFFVDVQFKLIILFILIILL